MPGRPIRNSPVPLPTPKHVGLRLLRRAENSTADQRLCKQGKACPSLQAGKQWPQGLERAAEASSERRGLAVLIFAEWPE